MDYKNIRTSVLINEGFQNQNGSFKIDLNTVCGPYIEEPGQVKYYKNNAL